MNRGTCWQEEGGQAPRFALPILSLAAHELKSPLALIRQLAQSLDGNYSAQEVEQIASRIRLTSERALRLATDLTRSERLQDTLFELEPIDPISICEDVVHEMMPLFRARDRSLKVNSRKRLPAAVANRELLRRVLINFADNALQYGGADNPVSFSTQSSRDGRRIRIAVRDYGPELPTDIWRSIQNAKQRPQPVSMRPESSGLGLYLASQFAESMNASLGVTRHRDGASFYIDLMGSTQLSLL